jgi:hypothetical protein
MVNPVLLTVVAFVILSFVFICNARVEAKEGWEKGISILNSGRNGQRRKDQTSHLKERN